jgi:hypothetical protein
MRRLGSFTLVLTLTLAACSSPSGSPDAGGNAGSGGSVAGSGGSIAGSGGSVGGSGGSVGGSGGSVGGSGGSVGGSGGAGAGGSAGGEPDGGVSSFAAVQEILASSCARCHDPAHPIVPETQTYIAMDLTAKDAYAALVRKPATETCGGTLVTPGDPTKSYLYAKITQDTPCDGERMPHQGMLRTPPLPDDQIATIAAWISGGAKP